MNKSINEILKKKESPDEAKKLPGKINPLCNVRYSKFHAKTKSKTKSKSKVKKPQTKVNSSKPQVIS